MHKKVVKKEAQPYLLINPELDKYKGQNLFPESLKQANEALKGINLQELMDKLIPKKD